MSKPLTVLEELNKKSDYPTNYSITREEIIAMHRREYEELIAKDKEELVRMLMGNNKYEDAKFWYFCFKIKENKEYISISSKD